MTLQHRDRIEVAREIDDADESDHETFTVERDGETVLCEELTVFNWVNVEVPSVVRGIGSIETFEAEIGAGDSPETPDAVTHWIAEQLDLEYGIDPEDYGIEVVDVTAEGVYEL